MLKSFKSCKKFKSFGKTCTGYQGHKLVLRGGGTEEGGGGEDERGRQQGYTFYIYDGDVMNLQPSSSSSPLSPS